MSAASRPAQAIRNGPASPRRRRPRRVDLGVGDDTREQVVPEADRRTRPLEQPSSCCRRRSRRRSRPRAAGRPAPPPSHDVADAARHPREARHMRAPRGERRERRVGGRRLDPEEIRVGHGIADGRPVPASQRRSVAQVAGDPVERGGRDEAQAVPGRRARASMSARRRRGRGPGRDTSPWAARRRRPPPRRIDGTARPAAERHHSDRARTGCRRARRVGPLRACHRRPGKSPAHCRRTIRSGSPAIQPDTLGECGTPLRPRGLPVNVMLATTHRDRRVAVAVLGSMAGTRGVSPHRPLQPRRAPWRRGSRSRPGRCRSTTSPPRFTAHGSAGQGLQPVDGPGPLSRRRWRRRVPRSSCTSPTPSSTPAGPCIRHASRPGSPRSSTIGRCTAT